MIAQTTKRCVPAIAGLLALFLALGLASGEASAQQTEPDWLGAYEDWDAFTLNDTDGKVCYMVSKPVEDKGDYAKRGSTYVMVAHRPAAKEIGVVSITAGYLYQEDSEANVQLGGQAFKLFTHNSDGEGRAWAYESKDDIALVAGMRLGLKMEVKGTSSRGTLTTDTYSLKGFSAASKAIAGACGIE